MMETMKRKYNIRNLDDLQARLSSLKMQNDMQAEAIVADGKAYLKQFTPAYLFKRHLNPSNLLKADEELHISSSIMSLILPFVMNNTLFKGSGIITKAVVGLASGKIGKTLDAENIANAFATVKSWFTGKKKKAAKPEVAYVDYGIPPDSETY
ncbi:MULTISPECIES: hypothetical protein [Pedobacter]|uniref:hypothetical protein n=1 Tax=Pedobacter TaxID=84567 RepID=UPI00210BE19F|nr:MULTISPECIES: hypothetical protein [unclassified Pedobacter]